MPTTQTILKRECYYDRAGRKRWKTVKQTRTVYSAAEREQQRTRIKRFLLRPRFVLLIGAVMLYLAVTINLHRASTREYQGWADRHRASLPAVYVTRAGHAYHTTSHYSSRTMRVSLFDAIRKGYSRCEVCKPPRSSLPYQQLRRGAPSYFGYGAALVFACVVYLTIASATFDLRKAECSTRDPAEPPAHRPPTD